MNDSIKKMLRLIEKDLMITEVSYETFQKKKTLIVDAVFSPAPHTCRNCGSTVVPPIYIHASLYPKTS
ncbi:hypothetical protein EfmJHP35_10770 [Enterococcus faecium]|nr:hypothetical protein EfmJHP35_10770 [Enterococcus faecium]